VDSKGGPVWIEGNAQECAATPNHRPTVLREATEWVASGRYDKVVMNRGINEYLDKPVCDPNIEPDLFGFRRGTGEIDMLEVRSKSQKTPTLKAKLKQARDQLPPERRGKNRVIDPDGGIPDDE
jgi:hypothetical protein